MPSTTTRGVRLSAALAGIVAAAVALGVAELGAALVGPRSAPLIAVGRAVIDLVPRQVKQFAIDTFGTSDKTALLIGTALILAAFAAVIGVLALKRRIFGVVGIGIFAAIGVVSALTRPYAGIADAFPSVLGALVGLYVLLRLIGSLGGTAPDIEVDRRRFMLTAGAAVVVTGLSGGIGRLMQRRFAVAEAREALRLPAPNDPAPTIPSTADLKVNGLTRFYTKNSEFYQIDTALVVPQIAPDDWSLRIHGRVKNPMTLSFDDLLGRELIERDITLACVSNEVGGYLAGNARWVGTPLKALLDEVQPDPGADQIVTRSADGWTCGTPTEVCRDGRDAMLAVAMNGEPLPIDHGFPVRMIVPGLYGYVSATKWIVDMELSTFADFDAYWVPRGWAAKAPIKTSSRIDTPKPISVRKKGDITVAGVAWAQQRGIDKVEVQIDNGPWQVADLSTEVNTDTWRQWQWQWRDAQPGTHEIRCRATDRTDATQTEEQARPDPDGATGWHSISVTIE